MNLKNFGKGRLVTRSKFVKEGPKVPSFYKIVSVHPHILEYPVSLRGKDNDISIIHLEPPRKLIKRILLLTGYFQRKYICGRSFWR